MIRIIPADLPRLHPAFSDSSEPSGSYHGLVVGATLWIRVAESVGLMYCPKATQHTPNINAVKKTHLILIASSFVFITQDYRS
jgi:hypothetical protein